MATDAIVEPVDNPDKGYNVPEGDHPHLATWDKFAKVATEIRKTKRELKAMEKDHAEKKRWLMKYWDTDYDLDR